MRYALLASLPCMLIGWAGCSYVPTDADQAVVEPRDGRVLYPPTTQPGQPGSHGLPAQPASHGASGVAIVYSFREDINLKGRWEERGPDDLHKGRKIYHQLVDDGAIKPEDVFVPAPADDQALLTVHTKHYLDSLDDRDVVTRIMGDNYPNWQSVADHRERLLTGFRANVGGTMRAAELAAAHGIAIHLGGGYTHAFADRGGRGSPLADVPIAIKMLRQRKLAQRIMVINLGALQANGVASMLAGDPDAWLLDVYESNNYPPTKQPENSGIAIEDGLGDSQYRQKLDDGLTRAIRDFRPEFVFFIAGADVVKGDPTGRTAMTLEGLVSRDLFVVSQVRAKSIPLCIILGGGSGGDSWRLHYRSIRGVLALYGGVQFHTEN